MVVLRGRTSKHLVALVNFLESAPLAPSVERPRAPARQFRLSEAQRVAVVAAYEGGASMADLAREYGVRRVTISSVLRRAGVVVRQARVMSQGGVDRAVELYADGLSLQKIGDQLGWDHGTIYRHLKKRGVVMRGASDWKY